jgi:outer membrane protein assembly factor BamB
MQLRAALSGFLLCMPGVVAGDWLQWRGPHFNGVAEGDAPVEWSDTKNVAWKTPLPGRAFSTPVVAGDRVFITNAIPAAEPPKEAGTPQRGPGGGSGAGIEHKLVVMALDRRTGKSLWQQTAATVMPHEGYHQRYGSFASYAPVTDGRHVWALFGSYGLYCYDVDGALKWKKELPKMKMKMSFGEGGAAVLHGSRLILNLDQESGSFIAVLDKTTGKELWRKDRDELSSWSTPLVVNDGGRQHIVVSATGKVRAYDLETGDVVWECGGLGANVIPAPVVSDGIVIVMSGFRNPNLLAIRLGRKGDLTGTDAIVWTNQRGNSYTPSPVLYEGKLYFVTDNGMLSCFDAATGKAYYQQQRLPKAYNFKASPVAAGGKLYLATEEGDVVVVKLGEKFEVAATNAFADQSFIASPVIVDGSVLLRSREALYCVRQ